MALIVDMVLIANYNFLDDENTYIQCANLWREREWHKKNVKNKRQLTCLPITLFGLLGRTTIQATIMGTQLYRSDGPACAMIIGGCPTAPGPGTLRTVSTVSKKIEVWVDANMKNFSAKSHSAEFQHIPVRAFCRAHG